MKSPFRFVPGLLTGVSVLAFAFLSPGCGSSTPDNSGNDTGGSTSTAKGGSGGSKTTTSSSKGGSGGSKTTSSSSSGGGGDSSGGSSGSGGDNSGGSSGSSSSASGGGSGGGGTTATTPTTTPAAALTGETVTFTSGKAAGAMAGWSWMALGSADTVTDPTCGALKAPITNAAPCLTTTNWSAKDKVCFSGSIPALPKVPTATDYSTNWGIQLGINVQDPPTAGTLTQNFSSITIATSGTPAVGLRAILHRKGDLDTVSYCQNITTGALLFSAFNTACWAPATGTALAAADVPNIDKIGLQVSSGDTAITVTDLCITGITFGK